MHTHLVTVLGRGHTNRDPSAPSGRYATATYRFDDDHLETSTFFGLALLRFLRSPPAGDAPNSLIILGTTESMWDGLVELLTDASDETASAAALKLFVTVSDRMRPLNTVDKDLLDELGEALQTHLRSGGARGLQVRLGLIPEARDAAQQLRIVHGLSELVGDRDRLWLDITHGLRHQGAILVSAANYLSHARSCKVLGIYYGAFELRGRGEPPAIQLDALERLAAWQAAMERYDATGDFGELTRVVEPTHPELGQALARLGFFERSFQPQRAADARVAALASLNQVTDGTLAALFRPRLQARITGQLADGDLASQQLTLARKALAHGQPVMAATYAHESWVSAHTQFRGLAPRDHEARKTAVRGRHGVTCKAFHDLRKLRNVLVHGMGAHVAEPGGWPQRALVSQEALTERLDKLIAISGCAGLCSHATWERGL